MANKPREQTSGGCGQPLMPAVTVEKEMVAELGIHSQFQLHSEFKASLDVSHYLKTKHL